MKTIARLLVLVISGIATASPALADSMTFGGAITQSTEDGTGPAGSNPLLNTIQDGDLYTITLTFAGSVPGAGTFNLTGLSVLFSDPTAAATESAFSTASITVTPSGGMDQVSVLACLAVGSGCSFGNFAALNFMIPFGDLNASGIAQPIPGLTPLDLLEDDGITDIQGTVTSYSYSSSGGTQPVPEPSLTALLCSGIFLMVSFRIRAAGR